MSHQVRPLERRKYMLKSLDQIETVNGIGVASRLTFPDREVLAEHADLKSMVELIKRMLTWESHERISPSAALRHPFVTLFSSMFPKLVWPLRSEATSYTCAPSV